MKFTAHKLKMVPNREQFYRYKSISLSLLSLSLSLSLSSLSLSPLSPCPSLASLPHPLSLSRQSIRVFEYLPLRVDEIVGGKLTLNSPDLGTYQYELHLVATPPSPEPPVHFTTMLGSQQVQQCRVPNYGRGRTEYSCKVQYTVVHR